MRFRTVVVAALLLVLAVVGAFAALQIGQDARRETAQITVERNDSLAVEPDIRQKLVSDADHDPTRYADSINVTYNGTQFTEGTEYDYFNESGEIEFLVNETAEANITYQYDIPRDQAADAQLQTATDAMPLIMRVAIGFAFVVVFLFIGGFAASRLRGTSTRSRGR
jgi:hypothetical protein